MPVLRRRDLVNTGLALGTLAVLALPPPVHGGDSAEGLVAGIVRRLLPEVVVPAGDLADFCHEFVRRETELTSGLKFRLLTLGYGFVSRDAVKRALPRRFERAIDGFEGVVLLRFIQSTDLAATDDRGPGRRVRYFGYHDPYEGGCRGNPFAAFGPDPTA